MATHPAPIDISTMPELAQLVKEVESTNTPRKLVRDNHVVAILKPAVSKKKRAKANADYAAFRAAFGSWKDVDTEKLLQNIYADRRRTNARPSIKL